jgi:hypothetical protein
MQLLKCLLTLRFCYLRVQLLPSHAAIETLVHKLRHALSAVRELALRRCICAERELALHLYMNVEPGLEHHRDGSDLAEHRHDGRDLAEHHRDGRVVRELVRRRCTYEERELALHLYMSVEPESEHHRDGRAGRESVLRRCICVKRGLDARLRSDREFRLAFRHLYAVVFRKDSKRHYCA